MNDIAVSKDGVIKLLKSLNPSKALGPDELHPRVLKELATELGPVFAHLFQQSIDTGEIPKEWSLANTGHSRYVNFAYLNTTTYVEVIFHSQHFFSIFLCISTPSMSKTVNT